MSLLQSKNVQDPAGAVQWVPSGEIGYRIAGDDENGPEFGGR